MAQMRQMTHLGFSVKELKEKWLIEHFKKSIENQKISQGNNGFWTLNKAATLAYYISFKSLEFEHHESAYNFQIKFCDLALILWEQVSNGSRRVYKM